MKPTRDDLALYAMGSYDGDAAALEAAIAEDEALRAQLTEEAELELLLRDAAAAAAFCPACDDLVRGQRCAACGCAVRPGGYVVERVLVANAHGRMYVARDADGKHVALKELAFVQSPGPDAVAAFEREAKFLRALEHPAIPRFCAAFEEGDGVHTRYYLAQELVTGAALDARLEQHFYTEAEIVELAKKVLAILVYLQGLSPMVIHRDIKPANLIVREDGSIALVDFGAAHVQGTTAGSTSIGTFGYMPIEQLAGQVDATTDVYALGATLVHLLTRQEPWRVMNAELIGTINVSAPLRRFLEKLVAPRREDRFPNAAAALAALDARDAVAVVPVKKRRVVPWRQLAYAAMAAIALGGAGAAGFALRGGHGGGHGGGVATPPMLGHATSVQQLPGACVDYLRAVAELERCSEVPEDTRARLLASHDALIDTSTLASDADAAQRGAHCFEASAQIRAETDAVCPGTRVLTFETPTPPTPPTPPIPPIPPIPPMPPIARIEHPEFANPKKTSIDVKAMPIADVLRRFANACDANVVLPEYVQASVTLKLDQVPCDQAIEVLLEAHGLWYRYEPSGKLLSILPRKELDRDDEEAYARLASGYADHPDLPSGALVDLDMKNAPIQDVIQMLAAQGKVNVIVPESIQGKTSVKFAKVSWDVALKGVLEAQKLWFRYRPAGRVVRIAPRRELDREDEEARARGER